MSSPIGLSLFPKWLEIHSRFLKDLVLQENVIILFKSGFQCNINYDFHQGLRCRFE